MAVLLSIDWTEEPWIKSPLEERSFCTLFGMKKSVLKREVYAYANTGLAYWNGIPLPTSTLPTIKRKFVEPISSIHPRNNGILWIMRLANGNAVLEQWPEASWVGFRLAHQPGSSIREKQWVIYSSWIARGREPLRSSDLLSDSASSPSTLFFLSRKMPPFPIPHILFALPLQTRKYSIPHPGSFFPLLKKPVKKGPKRDVSGHFIP